MKCLVTGAAGFIGSHLMERLLDAGHSVVGIDCFIDYYPRWIKEANLSAIRDRGRFEFVEADLVDIDLNPLLEDVDYVFHQAAQAGVRASWGRDFEVYARNNLMATQALLEAAKNAPLRAFVFASSSSVYGDAEMHPTPEDAPPRPISPYGVTKLAAEYLCRVYGQHFGVPVTILRYFSVYGPRQRPDMAFHRFIRALLRDEEITIYGDGEQTRDFTYISDAVEATILAMKSDGRGEVFNVGGGSRVSLNEVLRTLESIVGRPARVAYREAQLGDVRHTSADISRARARLGYSPQVRLEEGLRRQVEWMKEFALGERQEVRL